MSKLPFSEGNWCRPPPVPFSRFLGEISPLCKLQIQKIFRVKSLYMLHMCMHISSRVREKERHQPTKTHSNGDFGFRLVICNTTNNYCEWFGQCCLPDTYKPSYIITANYSGIFKVIANKTNIALSAKTNNYLGHCHVSRLRRFPLFCVNN